jgi:hypothetical protein
VLDYDPVANAVTAQHETMVAGASLDGMGLDGARLYVAAHGGGLLAFDAAPPFAPEPLAAPAALAEPWDVKPLGAGLLAVADGPNGLLLLDASADPAHPALLASLPLPGVSGFVRVVGSTAYVAALDGGAHVVDLADPAHPRLRATLDVGELVFDFAPRGALLLAATGRHLVAGTLGDGATIAVHDVHRSDGFALSLADGGAPDQLFTAEFAQVSRYAFHPERGGGAVAALPPDGIVAPVMAEKMHALSFPLRNLGSDPLHVDGVELLAVYANTSQAVAGAFDVAPGDSYTIPVDVTTAAGGDGEMFMVHVDAAALGDHDLALRQQPVLQAGDALPAPFAYNDAAGHGWDVSAAFANQVGVLVVAAATCPVAYYALQAAGHHLAPYLAAHQIVAFAIDPWDEATVEALAIRVPFPYLLSPLTTSDSHDHSHVLDLLEQPVVGTSPMPIVYVVGRDGRLVLARSGYDPLLVKAAIDAALAN